jgi:protocatechuate 3,4-dioxygenase beta subunit
MKNKLLLIGLLMAFSLSSTAQNGSLRGKVFDASTNKPLAYASVVVYQSSTGAITDGNGIFEFNTLYPGFVRIQVSLVGYNCRNRNYQCTNTFS